MWEGNHLIILSYKGRTFWAKGQAFAGSFGLRGKIQSDVDLQVFLLQTPKQWPWKQRQYQRCPTYNDRGYLDYGINDGSFASFETIAASTGKVTKSPRHQVTPSPRLQASKSPPFCFSPKNA